MHCLSDQFTVNAVLVHCRDGCVLGTGGFGTVRQVVHRGSGSKFAMKVVDLGGIKDPAEYKFVVNEVNIMKVCMPQQWHTD
jgi:hypothetical protein